MARNPDQRQSEVYPHFFVFFRGRRPTVDALYITQRFRPYILHRTLDFHMFGWRPSSPKTR